MTEGDVCPDAAESEQFGPQRITWRPNARSTGRESTYGSRTELIGYHRGQVWKLSGEYRLKDTDQLIHINDPHPSMRYTCLSV